MLRAENWGTAPPSHIHHIADLPTYSIPVELRTYTIEQSAFFRDLGLINPDLSAEEKSLALISLMENYHQPTAEHMKTVEGIAIDIAGILSLDPQLVRNSALLHDIGKAISPIAVIERKPGKVISDLEKSVLQNHQYYSFLILRQLNFPKLDCLTALYHHAPYYEIYTDPELFNSGYCIPSIVKMSDSLAAAIAPAEDRSYQVPINYRGLITNIRTKMLNYIIQPSLMDVFSRLAEGTEHFHPSLSL